MVGSLKKNGTQCSPQAVFEYRPISIRYSKCIGRYPLVSVDQGSILWRATFFFVLFFFSLAFFKSWHGFSPCKSPLFFPITLFFLLFFFPSIFHPFLSSSNFFLPLFPCLPSLFLSPILFHSFSSSSFFFFFSFLFRFFPLSFFFPFCCFTFLSSLHLLFSWLLPPFPLLSLSHLYPATCQ